MTATKQLTEVIGTVRSPDGEPSGEIDGLIIAQGPGDGSWCILTKLDSILWAKERLLWVQSRFPGVRPRWVEPIDRNGDGYYDYVRSEPDHTRLNNLLALPIWDRTRQKWIDPVTGYAALAPSPAA